MFWFTSTVPDATIATSPVPGTFIVKDDIDSPVGKLNPSKSTCSPGLVPGGVKTIAGMSLETNSSGMSRNAVAVPPDKGVGVIPSKNITKLPGTAFEVDKVTIASLVTSVSKLNCVTGVPSITMLSILTPEGSACNRSI